MNWIQTLKGEGDAVSKLVEKGKSNYVGPEILGKKLGIIGLGAIGILVANAAAALGMTVYGYDPYLSVDAAWGLSKEIIHAKTLKEIYENCDYITVHVPYNKETKEMINASSMATMKTGVRILNLARGELVNSADMLEALDSKKVAVYVTDFADDLLLGHEGVLAMPHLGASTPESEDNCAVMAVKQTMDYLENGNIVNSVNMPNVSMPKSGAKRICVIHKNVGGTISAASTAIAGCGLNIEGMVNGSRGDYAYSIFDVDKDSAEVKAAVENCEGIIRVRVI